jgi:hypothetical protein
MMKITVFLLITISALAKSWANAAALSAMSRTTELSYAGNTVNSGTRQTYIPLD